MRPVRKEPFKLDSQNPENDIWQSFFDYDGPPGAGFNANNNALFINAQDADSSERCKLVSQFHDLELLQGFSLCEDLEAVPANSSVKSACQAWDVESWNNLSLNSLVSSDAAPSASELKLDWNVEQGNPEANSPPLLRSLDISYIPLSPHSYFEGGSNTNIIMHESFTAEGCTGQDQPFQSADDSTGLRPRNVTTSIPTLHSACMPRYDGHNYANARFLTCNSLPPYSPSPDASASAYHSNSAKPPKTNIRESKSNANQGSNRRSTSNSTQHKIERNTDITFRELARYFHVPITQAARELKVGLTVLKKRCREFGIPRWPYRKMKSLESLIHNIQELGEGNGRQSQARISNAVEILKQQKRLMEEIPGTQLADRTKRLRQACFKANYRKRRQMMSSATASATATATAKQIPACSSTLVPAFLRFTIF